MSDTQRKTYIAIVEDDESLCRSLARLLQATGYQPVTYLSAEAFLGDTKHPEFDCLVTDIQLGGISGIELHEQLAQRGSTIPVVFLTAQEQADELLERLQDSNTTFLRKNDSGDRVLAAIDKAIHGTQP